MICPHCGNNVADGLRFCDSCGALLPEETTLEPSEGERSSEPMMSQAAGYNPGYEAFDVTGPDSTDIARPVASVPAHLVEAHGLTEGEAEEQLHAPQATFEDPAKGRGRAPIIFGVVLGAVMLVVLGWLFRAGASRMPNTPLIDAGSSTSQTATVDDGSAATSTTDPEPAPAKTPAADLPQPDVRDGLAAYSWEELSQISALINASESEEEVRAVAVRYHILNEDGTVPEAEKEFTLNNGRVLTARVIGIYHDDLADGSGKAGLSFVIPHIIEMHQMNAGGDNSGGWSGSDMRGWLNSDSGIASQLPEDLRVAVVPVAKLTNNQGQTSDVNAVTATSDVLWLFSEAELAGIVDWNWNSEASSTYSEIVSIEGEQYQLFRELGITGDVYSEQLVFETSAGTRESWWLRTPRPSSASDFSMIGYDGYTNYPFASSNALGVVIGFCV